MKSIIFVAFFAFVGVHSQIFAPYSRTVPTLMTGCPCGNPGPLPPMKIPCELPLQLPVPATVPRPVAKAPCDCFDATLPAGFPLGLPFGNPFLPVASPVSAMAPFSPLLPPASTCSRCQYLKKIPIPPPCI